MESLRQDIRYGLRILIKNPAFAATVIGILALGVGANTAIFSVVDAVLLEALPFEDAERLVIVRGVAGTPEGPQTRPASYPDIYDWRARASEISGLAAFSSVALNLTGGEEAERVLGEIVSHGYFSSLRVEPARGRLFSEAETLELDAHPVVLISDALWRRRFDAAPDAVRQELLLAGRAYRVVGVMQPGFAGLSMQADLWIPMAMVSAVRPAGILEARDGRWLLALGRLADGSSLEQAQLELDSISVGLAEEFPDTNRDRGVQLQTLRQNYVGNLQLTLTVLLASVGAVLLIACANVTNLLLARSTARSSELVVRQALGAGRARLARQVLTESLTLAVCGGAAGVLVTLWAVEGLRALIPAGVLPVYVDLSLSPRVFAFTSIVTMGSVRRGSSDPRRGARSELAAQGRRARSRRRCAEHGFAIGAGYRSGSAHCSASGLRRPDGA